MGMFNVDLTDLKKAAKKGNWSKIQEDYDIIFKNTFPLDKMFREQLTKAMNSYVADIRLLYGPIHRKQLKETQEWIETTEKDLLKLEKLTRSMLSMEKSEE